MNGTQLRASQAVATEDPSERLAMKKGGAGNIKKPGAREYFDGWFRISRSSITNYSCNCQSGIGFNRKILRHLFYKGFDWEAYEVQSASGHDMKRLSA